MEDDKFYIEENVIEVDAPLMIVGGGSHSSNHTNHHSDTFSDHDGKECLDP